MDKQNEEIILNGIKNIENIENRIKEDNLLLKKLKFDLNKMISHNSQKLLNSYIEYENCYQPTTLKDYLKKLLVELWVKGECFNSNRPFGDSDWKLTIIYALMKKGLIPCKNIYTLCGELEVDPTEQEEKDADFLIEQCIYEIFS